MKNFEVVERWGKYADMIYQDVLYNDWTLEDWSTKNEYDAYEENSYIPDDNDFIEIVKISLDIKKRIEDKEIKLYNNRLLELSDNHTLWQIEQHIENNESQDFISEYSFEVAKKLNTFERETGIEIFTEGRSGRHICVKNTLKAACKYKDLCELQRRLEKELIEMYA